MKTVTPASRRQDPSHPEAPTRHSRLSDYAVDSTRESDERQRELADWHAMWNEAR